MKFLLSALGSAGDVHPFIALGRALLQRGHAVRLLAAWPFEARVVRAGIDFRPVGRPGEYERLLEAPGLWDARRGTGLLIDHLLAQLPDVLARTVDALDDDGTVLVGSTLSWQVRLLQEQRGLRAATVHLSPICVMSATDPAVLPGGGDPAWIPPRVLRWLQLGAERWLIDPRIVPRLDALRASLGLPPVRRIISRWQHSPQLVLCAWPDWFAAHQADWPANSVTTGFPMFMESGDMPPALGEFLAAGPPPIGITPGSAMAQGGNFLRQTLAACERLGLRALVISPYRDQMPSRPPPGTLQVDYAPFGQLLPRLAALVHHGGIGTSAQAIAAGIPQLVMPFAHDQFDNAARLRRLGLAAALRADAGADAIVRELRAISDGTAMRARAADYARRMDPDIAPSIAMRLENLGSAGRTY